MTEWGRARRKPIVVDYREVKGDSETFWTPEGLRQAFSRTDYIIKGAVGELYPIKKDIFHKTYDIVVPYVDMDVNSPELKKLLDESVKI
jgi:hypothetical protein